MSSGRTDNRARALWYVAAGRAEIREEELPSPAAGEVRVRSLYGALSRGTEALVLAGRVPASEYERMRAPFMAGQFPFPVKYGYATVGEVESGASKGRAAFALYPHQTRFNIGADALVLLPEDVPPQRAVLAANMETALNAVWDAEPMASGRVAVIGAGVVGTLAAYLFSRIHSVDVTLVDTNPARAGIARGLGLKFAAPGEAPSECNLTVHASGTAAGLASALSAAAFEATVLELSWYGDAPVPVPLGGAFHSRRLRLVSSQVGHVAPSHRAKTSRHDRLRQAVSLLTDARLDALLSPPVQFDELPHKLPHMLDAKGGVLCQLIAY